MPETPDKIINEWKEAYSLANKKEPPQIRYDKGWVSIGWPTSKYRKKQVQMFTKELQRRIAESSIESNE